jgi:hypothetical protein
MFNLAVGFVAGAFVAVFVPKVYQYVLFVGQKIVAYFNSKA